jgi:hypothetical protein
MRVVLWIVGALWTAIGAWYLYRSFGTTSDVTALGYSLIFGMLLYIFPGLVLMALGALLGKRRSARRTVVETVSVPTSGAVPAAAAGTGAAVAAAAAQHEPSRHLSAIERLDELQGLRTKNLITQAEFERKRSEIIRNI